MHQPSNLPLSEAQCPQLYWAVPPCSRSKPANLNIHSFQEGPPTVWSGISWDPDQNRIAAMGTGVRRNQLMGGWLAIQAFASTRPSRVEGHNHSSERCQQFQKCIKVTTRPFPRGIQVKPSALTRYVETVHSLSRSGSF